MKKKILVVILVLMLITMLVPSLFAAGYPSNLPSVSAGKSLKSDVEITGILPTSKFYFLKELGRGVRRIFTVDPISKAEFELQVVSQKVAELRKLKELYPHDSGSIKSAILAGSENIKEVLENLKAEHAIIEDQVEEVQSSLQALTE